MKLLLQRKVPGLGDVGDVVEITDGYGRNYLLPQRLAVPNTPDNRRDLETQKLLALQKEAQRKELAEHAFKALKNFRLEINMKAQDDGSLYGSVSQSVVAEAVEKSKGFRLEDRWIQLPVSIKKIGDYDVQLKMPGELEATIKLTVLPEGE